MKRVPDGVLDNLDYAANDDLQIGQVTQIRPQTLLAIVAELRALRLTGEERTALGELAKYVGPIGPGVSNRSQLVLALAVLDRLVKP